jgi:hypothetical protein
MVECDHSFTVARGRSVEDLDSMLGDLAVNYLEDAVGAHGL